MGPIEPSSDDFPLRTISARDVYADALGNWVVMDDDPDSDQVLLVPLPFDHRQVVSRREAIDRLRPKP